MRLKLLDLTSRNRLINFKHTAGKSLPFIEGQPADIFQKLVETTNKSVISIDGLPEPDRHFWIERNGRLQRPDPIEWAGKHEIPTSYELPFNNGSGNEFNVRALLYPDDLAKHCRKIDRDAKSAIEETGANMLFLVLGFLEFPDQQNADRVFLAPLVSIPVTLIRKESVGSQYFSLQYTGDDITENLSLSEKLKNDFGLILPDLGEEQADEHIIIDVEKYFTEIYKIIEKKPRFFVKRRVSLCLLSFTNMLLYKDLDSDNWPQQGDINELLNHSIVREVLEGSANEVESGFGRADEHHVEEEPGVSIPLIYDADSSQHSALIDVLIHKKNLVIEGPPGTGKSQTITNLIAASLSEGKKVLFVAEKMAALEVVRNKLMMAGLDPFVLELHSNKTNKKQLLDEIRKRVNFKSDSLPDLHGLSQQREANRDNLKTYADLINSVVQNSFGQTLHQIMWTAEKHRSSLSNKGLQLIRMTIPDATEIPKFELSRRIDCLGHLSSQYVSIGGFNPDSPFWGFYPEQIIPGDEAQLANIFVTSQNWAKKLNEDIKTLSGIIDGKISRMTLELANYQLELLEQFLSRNRTDLHCIPSFFEVDRTGEKAQTTLLVFRSKIQRYFSLQILVNTALKSESSVTKEKLSELKRFSKLAYMYGVKLGNQEELHALKERLTNAETNLVSAIESIKEFAKNKTIPFDGEQQGLSILEKLVNLIIEVPIDYIHLQSSALNQDDATQAIKKLSILQEQWVSIQREINETLYLDILPNEERVKQAIQTLREGDAWYRIFQSSWRNAISLHKSMQRTKHKISSNVRLAQLEKIATINNLKKKWMSDPTWERYLNISAPTEAMNIGGYAILAKWNQEINLFLEETNLKVIDPVNLTKEQARTEKREYSIIKNQLEIAKHALHSIDTELIRLNELPGVKKIERVVIYVRSFLLELDPHLDWFMLEVNNQVNYHDVIVGCEAAIERIEIVENIDRNTDAKSFLGGLFKGVNTDVADITKALESLAFGMEIDKSNLLENIKDHILSNNPIDAMNEIKVALNDVVVGLLAIAEFVKQLGNYGEFDLNQWVGVNPENNFLEFTEILLVRLSKAIQSSNELIAWSIYVDRRRDAHKLGLSCFKDLLESKSIEPFELANFYGYCVYSTIVREAFKNIPELGRFTGLKHNEICKEFKRLDKEIIRLRGRFIAKQCVYKAIPPRGNNGVRVDDKTQMTLLDHLLPQQRPRMPLRKVLQRAGKAIECLKPCFMMGPQAVAQYLTPGAIKFDLVIMDEASQLKPEEAIGAIARGGQLVVVGDANQLPPTTFFQSHSTQGNNDDEQYTITDTESILDVCSSQFKIKRSLRWHYRSQHHSLIAFSNHAFYDNNLIVFPSPYGQGGKLGIKATYLTDAIYENQTNFREAKRVVDAVVDHIINRADDSVGVVTLNIKQRDLIAELFEERIKTFDEAAIYKANWVSKGQPLFFKSLENVQGDERDAVIISTTFGKSSGSNEVRQNFGPISRQGGWRRLNVLFTRAKKSISIYTSLRPEDIVMDGTTPDGTKALRNYLEYARTGLLTFAEETNHEPDSDFEISVMKMLRQSGYDVTPQLGVAGYRIDIAVKHPDSPGSYLAAIECDGASYHSALSVRDRDRIRQEILESIGWRGRIWRIWSTDWFRSPRQEFEKLISFLEDLRRNWKPEYLSGESWIEEGQIITVKEEIIADTTPLHQEMVYQTNEEERKEVNSVLIESDEDIDIEVGDSVSYVDVLQPTDILYVKITQYKTDIDQGLISEKTPLAQIMLGAVIGDEVTLHLPCKPPRIFRITEIKKDGIL